MTSGALAKLYLKETTSFATSSLPTQLPWLLSIAAVGTVDVISGAILDSTVRRGMAIKKGSAF